MLSESQSTRLGDMKQDIQEFYNEFNSLILPSLKNGIHPKSENIKTRLNEIENYLENEIT